MQQAERIRKLPPYLFARIEQKVAEAKEKGVDIISLGIGDPDQPSPSHVIEALQRAAEDSTNHQYPSSVGMLEFRKSVADFYKRRFNVDLDPKSEVVTLVGSKEGIANISYCYIDPGDINLVPDPGYPVYGIGTLLAGGEPYLMPLKEENGFLPDLTAIPEEVARKAKLMFINYPNNPTGATAELDFYRDVVAFAKKYDLIVCSDAAYSEVTFDGYVAPSFMEAEGAKDVGIEFFSLSKPFNMTGWRIAAAVGRADVVEALGRIKSNIDSGAFQAVQLAAKAGLDGSYDVIRKTQEVYSERMDVCVEGLRELGWNLEKPKGTFYIWVKVPKGYTSAEFAETVLEKAGVIITPGNGYGQYGEGYFRISLCIDKERIREALKRMKDGLGKIEL